MVLVVNRSVEGGRAVKTAISVGLMVSNRSSVGSFFGLSGLTNHWLGISKPERGRRLRVDCSGSLIVGVISGTSRCFRFFFFFGTH